MTKNTIKTLRNGLLLSALAVGSLASTAVKADEVTTTPEANENQATTAATPTSSKELKPLVDTAKVTLDEAQQSYVQAVTAENTQKEIVETSTTAVNETTAAVSQATANVTEAEELVKVASPEAIAQQETQVENDKQAIVENEQKVEQAKVQADNASKAENLQQASVQSATNQVSVANQAVSQAQAGVDTAKANLEGTEQGKLVAEVANLKDTVAKSQDEVAAATTALNASKQDESTLQANVNKQLSDLETALKNSGNPEIVETVKTVVGSALFNYNYTDGRFASAGQVLHEEMIFADGVLKEEILKSEISNTLDVNKLSQYIAEYITAIRKLNGIEKPVTVTTSAMNFATDRAKEMDNGSAGHSTNLKATDYGHEAYDEGLVFTTVRNLSEKEVAYNVLKSLFNEYNNTTGDNYGHRESLLLSGSEIGVGLSYNGSMASVVIDYLGNKNDLEVYKRNGGFTNTAVFSITNNDNDPQKSEHWYNGKRLVFLPKAEMNYITTEDVAKPNQAYIAANQALETFKALSAADLANQANIVAQNQAKLDTAQAKLIANQAALATAETNLGAVTASVEKKAKALATAEAKLDQAKADLKVAEEKRDQEQAKLAQAQTATKSAQEAVKNAKKALADAQAKLASDEDRLAKLKDAAGNLAKAKAQLDQANKAQDEAKATLEAEQAKLAGLIEATTLAKTKLDEAQQAFDKVNQEYNTLLQLENPVVPSNPSNNTSAGKQTTYTAGQQAAQTVAPKITETATAVKAIPVKNNTATVTTSANTAKTLPNTGSETSSLALIGMSLIGLLGLAKIRKTVK